MGEESRQPETGAEKARTVRKVSAGMTTIVRASVASGMSLEDACTRLGLSRSTYYLLRKELADCPQTPAQGPQTSTTSTQESVDVRTLSEHPTYGMPLWAVQTPAGLLVCFAKSNAEENFSANSEEGGEEYTRGREPWTEEDQAASDRMARLYEKMKERGLV